MTLLGSHRAAAGATSVAAITLLLSLPSGWPEADSWYWLSRAGLASLWLAGLMVLAASPYWKIVYREAPLRQAMTGASDLDERELGLRDRAAGLTYSLLVATSLLLMFIGGLALDAGWIALDGNSLNRAIIPYAFFATCLPIIMMEWFEPSGPAPYVPEDDV